MQKTFATKLVYKMKGLIEKNIRLANYRNFPWAVEGCSLRWQYPKEATNRINGMKGCTRIKERREVQHRPHASPVIKRLWANYIVGEIVNIASCKRNNQFLNWILKRECTPICELIASTWLLSKVIFEMESGKTTVNEGSHRYASWGTPSEQKRDCTWHPNYIPQAIIQRTGWYWGSSSRTFLQYVTTLHLSLMILSTSKRKKKKKPLKWVGWNWIKR